MDNILKVIINSLLSISEKLLTKTTLSNQIAEECVYYEPVYIHSSFMQT